MSVRKWFIAVLFLAFVLSFRARPGIVRGPEGECRHGEDDIGDISIPGNRQMKTAGVKKMKVTELTDYIGKSDHPLIVNFWATYCAPCNKEIPYFQSTVDKYKASGVELILVSLDMPDYYPAKIDAFAKSRNYTVPLIWLDESNADYFCPKVDSLWTGGIPSSLFINNKTHYRKFFDRQLTDLQVDKEIRSLIAQ